MKTNMFYIALAINVGADLTDLMLIGLVPMIGDIIDIGVMAINWFVFKIGPVTFLSSAELLPFGVTDALPIHTSTLLSARLMRMI
tara:strand:+ start:464 stop:718 length:255 start_codon:yes stop_codon:yes gene_type:complete